MKAKSKPALSEGAKVLSNEENRSFSKSFFIPSWTFQICEVAWEQFQTNKNLTEFFLNSVTYKSSLLLRL